MNLVMLLVVLAAGVASSHSPRFRFSSTGPPRLSETGRLPQRTQALQRLRGGIILAEELQLCVNLLEAAVLGSVIGVERGWAGRPAGIRTMSMVCMGAALFTGVASSSNRSVDAGTRAAQCGGTVGWLACSGMVAKAAAEPAPLAAFDALEPAPT